MTRSVGLPSWPPFLAAWYIGLTLLVQSGGVPRGFGDVVGTVLFATVTAGGSWLLAALVVRDRVRATSVATLIVLWAALFGSVRILAAPVFSASSSGAIYALGVWTLVIGLLCLLVALGPRPGERVVRALTVALSILVVFQVFSLTRQPRGSATAPVSGEPWLDRRADSLPDIYIVVLDKYSSPRALRENYALDVTPFLDSLRALGFTVPSEARSNYIHTQLVLATLLNGRLAHAELSADGDVWGQARRLTEDAMIWDVLKERGYRFVFFTTGFPGTVSNRNADLHLTPPVPRRMRFGQTWLVNTPFDLLASVRCLGGRCGAERVWPYPVETAAANEWKLEQLATLPDSAGPVVAFLHFLGSHEPYTYDRDCRHSEPWWPATDFGPDSAAVRVAYATQIDCVNRRLLPALRRIVERSAVPPIILLQSDHGHGRIAVDPVRGITLPFATATSDQVAERIGVFAAYRFPDADRLVYDSITPVNVVPLMMNRVFGTSLPLSPNRSYWSTYQAPLELTEVRRP